MAIIVAGIQSWRHECQLRVGTGHHRMSHHRTFSAWRMSIIRRWAGLARGAETPAPAFPALSGPCTSGGRGELMMRGRGPTRTMNPFAVTSSRYQVRAELENSALG